MINVTRLGMLLAVSICSMPMWAMSHPGNAKPGEDTWKAAWARGVQHHLPIAEPPLKIEVELMPVTLSVPSERDAAIGAMNEPMLAEAPFLSFGTAVQPLLTER